MKKEAERLQNKSRTIRILRKNIKKLSQVIYSLIFKNKLFQWEIDFRRFHHFSNYFTSSRVKKNNRHNWYMEIILLASSRMKKKLLSSAKRFVLYFRKYRVSGTSYRSLLHWKKTWHWKWNQLVLRNII